MKLTLAPLVLSWVLWISWCNQIIEATQSKMRITELDSKPDGNDIRRVVLTDGLYTIDCIHPASSKNGLLYMSKQEADMTFWRKRSYDALPEFYTERVTYKIITWITVSDCSINTISTTLKNTWNKYRGTMPSDLDLKQVNLSRKS